MRENRNMIDNIPIIVYGENSGNWFLYVHGKQGFKEEAEPFAEIVATKGWQVLSINRRNIESGNWKRTGLIHGALCRK